MHTHVFILSNGRKCPAVPSTTTGYGGSWSQFLQFPYPAGNFKVKCPWQTLGETARETNNVIKGKGCWIKKFSAYERSTFGLDEGRNQYSLKVRTDHVLWARLILESTPQHLTQSGKKNRCEKDSISKWEKLAKIPLSPEEGTLIFPQ